MRSFYPILSLLLFLFQGCSSTKITPQPTASVNSTAPTQSNFSSNVPDNSMADSFEDEFTQDEATQSTDDFNAYNRAMTSFNDVFYSSVLDPVSKVYGDVVPQPFRLGISNFIQNLQFPVRLANNLLQFKLQNSAEEFESFLTNSTIGLGGLMNPAQDILLIPVHDEDFGQTLGYYNIVPGPHIVLPFLGPSNARDLLGVTLDAYASPWVNVRGLERYKIPNNLAQSVGVIAVQMTNKNSLNPGVYESLKKDALDLYPFFKDAYEQKRAAQIAR